MLVTNSTIARNRGRGGLGGAGGVVNGPITLQNSLVALNIDTSTGLPSDCFISVRPASFSLGNNLIGDPTHCGFTASDRQGDPGLGEFIDDGAPGHDRFRGALRSCARQPPPAITASLTEERVDAA